MSIDEFVEVQKARTMLLAVLRQPGNEHDVLFYCRAAIVALDNATESGDEKLRELQKLQANY